MDKQSSNKQIRQKGSMMIEVLVVSTIIVASVLAALIVAQKSIYLSRQSLHQSQAAFLLDEGAEATRILRDNGWAGVSGLTPATDHYISFSGGTWTFSTTPSSVGIFTRKITPSLAYRDGSQNLAPSGTLDNQTRLITVTVSWADAGETFTKTLQFYLTDLFS
jgi:hypothetical protein